MIAKISRYEDARKNGVYQYCVTWNERFNQKMFGQGRVSSRSLDSFVVPGEGIDSRLTKCPTIMSIVKQNSCQLWYE